MSNSSAPGGYEPLASEVDQDVALPLPHRSRPRSNIQGHQRFLDTGGTLTTHPDGESYSYAYGPTGLAGLWFNKYALACAIWASIGGLTFGYDQGVIANILVMKDFTQRFPVGPWEKGLLTAMLELGCLVGALCAGIFADFFSRRQSIIIACSVFCLGSALQFAAQTIDAIVVGRAIGGLGVGALSMLSPLYMAEISPPELRGSLMALEQFSIVSGAVLGFCAGFITRDVPGSASWRIPFGVQLIPGVLLAFGSSMLPPSPRLLVAHGRYDDALYALARLRKRTRQAAESDPLLRLELLEMRTEVLLIEQTFGITSKEGGFRGEVHAWGYLFRKKYLRRTLIGIMMMFFQQWSGINAFLYYGPTLMRSLGLQGDTISLLVSGGVGVVQFLAVLPAILYIDRVGRKPLLRWGSSVMCFAHLCIALLVMQFDDQWPTVMAWTAVGCVYLFTAAYGVSYGPIGWILPSEVFPLSVRSKGVALSTASNWFNNCYFWSTYVVPETANVSLEEIDAVFGTSAGHEDTQLRRQIELDLGLPDFIANLTRDPDSQHVDPEDDRTSR
ncbi:hypothetical protein NLI96_g10591 [Meripilus lineatus]|uniref:Major facilitator superfamily (MFS) profile domain-containing protein n=1 Tax=Meripilus lineatus TaxID=2056292 RepID=A0AAD5UTB6_9APHY|nr:hypothetical protein NLI96_g10591 [Physisporinus lineatus]